MRGVVAVLALVLLAGVAHAQDEPRMAPVQIEWTMQADAVVWFDCWPSDGHTQSDVWVYLTYADGTAPYVCHITSRVWIRPAPIGQQTIVQAKAVQ